MFTSVCDYSFINVDQLESMENYFKTNLEKVLHLLLSLPDSQLKAVVIKASIQY